MITDGKRKSLGQVSDYCACQHVLGLKSRFCWHLRWSRNELAASQDSLHFTTDFLLPHGNVIIYKISAYYFVIRSRDKGSVLRWPTTVTAKANHSRQKQIKSIIAEVSLFCFDRSVGTLTEGHRFAGSQLPTTTNRSACDNPAIRWKVHNSLAFHSTTRDWQEVSSQSYAAVLPVGTI